MINLYKYSDKVFDIFCNTYYPHLNDLMQEINFEKANLKDFDAEINYNRLYLSENQQIVINKYIDSIIVQSEKSIMIAYAKAIEYTLEYLNNAKHKNTPQE